MNVAIICELNPFHKGHSRIFSAARALSRIPRERSGMCEKLGGKIIAAEAVDELLDEFLKSGGSASAGRDRERTKDRGRDLEQGLVFAVMSGNFCERGEPALLDKWTRARVAAECGADAVVEIPSVYSAASAQFFADAAVDIVTGLGCVDVLLFGSECGDGRLLSEAARKRLAAFDNVGLLRIGEDAGESFPKAMERFLGVKLAGNDILAVEYMCALTRRESSIVPAICRIRENACEDIREELPGNAVSHVRAECIDPGDHVPGMPAHANEIRKIFDLYARTFSGEQWNTEAAQTTIAKAVSQLEEAMPQEAFAVFSEKIKAGEFVGGITSLENIILAEFRKMTPSEADRLPFADDGLGRKILGECLKSGSLSEVIQNCTGKAYTEARVKRTAISVITGAGRDTYPSTVHVPYVRLLAVRKSVNISALAAAVAAEREAGGRQRDLILGNVPGNYEKSFSEDTVRLLSKEILASDLYALGVKAGKYRAARREFTCGLISL